VQREESRALPGLCAPKSQAFSPIRNDKVFCTDAKVASVVENPEHSFRLGRGQHRGRAKPGNVPSVASFALNTALLTKERQV
jgi:hypothetical protein